MLSETNKKNEEKTEIVKSGCLSSWFWSVGAVGVLLTRRKGAL
jgi:hypothetical protein